LPRRVGDLDGARRIHFAAFARHALYDGAAHLGGIVLGRLEIGMLAARFVADQGFFGAVMEKIARHRTSLIGDERRAAEYVAAPTGSVCHCSAAPSSLRSP